MGRAWDRVQVPLFLLVHQMDSQKLAILWLIPPTQTLLSTHLIKQKEQKVGGGVLGQRGHRNLARVALVVQPVLA